MALRPINRIKHVVDSQGAVGIGTPVIVDLIDTTDTPTIAVSDACETGSKVNGVYIVCEAYGTTAAALSNFYFMVFKNPGNELTMPNGNIIGTDDKKRYVIHQEMVMLQKEVAGIPRTIFKGVIAIPRGYRRNGPNDRLSVQLFTPGVNVDYCLQCHYKEYR